MTPEPWAAGTSLPGRAPSFAAAILDGGRPEPMSSCAAAEAAAPSKQVRLPRQKKRLAWRKGQPSTIRKADHTKEAASGQASG